MKQKPRGSILGLLAIFGAIAGGLGEVRLPSIKFKRRATPSHIHAARIAAAVAKRRRKASAPGASHYSRANGNRDTLTSATAS